MRISHTVWIRGKDPFDIILISAMNDAGDPQYMLIDHQTEKVLRVLSQTEYKRLQACLEGLTLPVVPLQSIDKGNAYMLQLENEFNSVTYYWSSHPPVGWEGLKDLSKLLVDVYNGTGPKEYRDVPAQIEEWGGETWQPGMNGKLD